MNAFDILVGIKPPDVPLDAELRDEVRRRLFDEPLHAGADPRLLDDDSDPAVLAVGSPPGPRVRFMLAKTACALVCVGLAAALLAGPDRLSVASRDWLPRVIAANPGAPDPGAPTASPATVEGHLAMAAILAPTQLPDGWRVWYVGRITSPGIGFTRQVFGSHGAVGFRGLSLSFHAENPHGGVADEAHPVALRETIGWRQTTELGDRLLWEEQGIWIEATGRGLDGEGIVGALLETELRSDPLDGFDPATLPTGFDPLWDERSRPDDEVPLTVYRLTSVEDPSMHPFALARDAVGDITVIAGDRSSQLATPAEAILRGHPAADGAVRWENGAMHTMVGDEVIVRITSADEVDPAVIDQVLGGIQPIDPSEIRALDDEASRWLQRLPELAVAEVGDHLLTLRGLSIEHPFAICIVAASGERCQWALEPGPMAPAGQVIGTFDVDGEWIIASRTPGFAEAEPLRLTSWTAEPDDSPAIESSATLSDESGTWTVSIVPAGITTVDTRGDDGYHVSGLRRFDE